MDVTLDEATEHETRCELLLLGRFAEKISRQRHDAPIGNPDVQCFIMSGNARVAQDEIESHGRGYSTAAARPR